MELARATAASVLDELFNAGLVDTETILTVMLVDPSLDANIEIEDGELIVTEDTEVVESPSGWSFRASQENGDRVDCQACGNPLNDDYPIVNDEEGYAYHEGCLEDDLTVLQRAMWDEKPEPEGIHEDEFPDEHSHEPEFTTEDGTVRAGVFACDDEGRHYWLSIKLTSEGIIADVFDRYGEDLIATLARTYDEFLELVQGGAE